MNPDPNLCCQNKDDGGNSIDLLIIVASGPSMSFYPVFFFQVYLGLSHLSRFSALFNLCCHLIYIFLWSKTNFIQISNIKNNFDKNNQFLSV